MNAEVPVRQEAFTPPVTAPVRRGWKMPALLVFLAVLLGAAGWYYFLGRKPKMALSFTLPAADSGGGKMWQAGAGHVVVLAGGEVSLVDMAARVVKWSTKMPAAQAVDPRWQAAVNARFLRLQQWADELSRKRAALKTAAETKAFNEEAARYLAELSAARAEAANPRPVSAHGAEPGPAAEPAPAAVGPASPLRPVVDTRLQLIEERVMRRAGKLDAWRRALDAKKAAAKTELQKGAVRDEEAVYAGELAEQTRDQSWIAKAKSAAAGADTKTAPPAESEGGAEVESDWDTGSDAAVFTACGAHYWIIEDRRAVAFDDISGSVKAEVRLAGPALAVGTERDQLLIAASAGPGAAQLTRISGTAPQAFYVPVARRVSAPSGEGDDAPNVQALRTEFVGGAGGLLRADIRLVEKRIHLLDAVNPATERSLEEAAAGAAAHSMDEVKALSSLMANDAARIAGKDKEYSDQSTYEVVLSRPFDPSKAAWKGTLTGRVQVFSSASLDLVTAGIKLLAFDRANSKRWEVTLGSAVPIRDGESGGEPRPMLEADGHLFFADGAFLSSIDAQTGAVRWRLPSVGIRKIERDADGGLYVLSANGNAASLTYVNDASLRDSVPLLMRVGAADGKIRWSQEKYEDVWVSGGDVYAFREGHNGADMENQVFDPAKAPEARVKIYKLSRGGGRPLWEWFQARRPHAVAADRKSVALLFSGELQIVHSICW